jgi:hypothetical protein
LIDETYKKLDEQLEETNIRASFGACLHALFPRRTRSRVISQESGFAPAKRHGAAGKANANSGDPDNSANHQSTFGNYNICPNSNAKAHAAPRDSRANAC